LRERALRLDALGRLGDGRLAFGTRRDRFARRAPEVAAPLLPREVQEDAREPGPETSVGDGRRAERREPGLLDEIPRRSVVAHEPAREPVDPGRLGEQRCGIDRGTRLFGALHEAIMPPPRKRWPNPGSVEVEPRCLARGHRDLALTDRFPFLRAHSLEPP